MRRREFIGFIAGAAATWPLSATAEQPLLGYLSSLTREDSVRFDSALRRGLADMGYVDGRNLTIEARWITDRYDPLPGMAADLVQRRPSVIVAGGPPAVLAAKAATNGIPVVFITGADPIKFGFVNSFNKPGGNVTGIWMVTTILAEKRLQLVHELLPKARSIGLLVNPTSPVAEPQIRDAQVAARALGLSVNVLNAVTEDDFEPAFAALVRQHDDALFVSADPFLSSRREHLVALAARHAIPTLYEFRDFVEAGGLISYGTVFPEGYYKGGIYAGRILRGVKPGDLPVEQMDKLELVINLKTAKTLGVDIPPNLLAIADEVIE